MPPPRTYSRKSSVHPRKRDTEVQDVAEEKEVVEAGRKTYTRSTRSGRQASEPDHRAECVPTKLQRKHKSPAKPEVKNTAVILGDPEEGYSSNDDSVGPGNDNEAGPSRPAANPLPQIRHTRPITSHDDISRQGSGDGRLSGSPPSEKPAPASRTALPASPGRLYTNPIPSPRARVRTPELRKIVGKGQSSNLVLETPSKRRRADLEGGWVNSPVTPPRSLSRTQSLPEGFHSQANSPGLLMSPSGREQIAHRPSVRTYGRSRSFVNIEGDSETGDHGSPSKASYFELRTKYEVSGALTPAELDQSPIPNALARPPQTISDMRSRGENRRFIDEAAFLVDGIRDPTASWFFRQSSSIDLLENMLNAEWLAKIKLCGELERVWLALMTVERGNAIMDSASLLFLVMVVSSGSGLATVATADLTGLLHVLTQALSSKEDLLDTENRNPPTAVIKRLRDALAASSLGAKDQTSRSLGSFVLANILQLTSVLHAVNRAWTIRIMDILSSSLQDELDLVQNSLNKEQSIRLAHASHISQAVASLASLVANVEHGSEVAMSMDGSMPAAIASALICFVAVTEEHLSHPAGKVVYDSLRVLANMINISQAWSRRLASLEDFAIALTQTIARRQVLAQLINRDVISNGDDPDVAITTPEELLCLALSLMTTLATTHQDFCSRLGKLEISGNCSTGDRWRKEGYCQDGKPFHLDLVRLYCDHASGEGPNDAVIKGYLALLLSNLLLLQDDQVQESILSRLPGQSQTDRFDDLLQSLSELSEFQEIVQRKLNDMDEVEEEGESQLSGDATTLVYGSADVVERTIARLKEIYIP